MTRKHFGIVGALVATVGFGVVAPAHAQSDAVKNCIAQWVTSCSAECATARCVSNCTTQAHAVCEQNITAPQNVFSGPVNATPVQCEAPPVAACAPPVPITIDSTSDTASAPCSSVSGTVANQAMCGGAVTMYIICPAFTPAGHQNEAPTTTIIAQAVTDATTCGFNLVATNACAGATGCYGLLAVTPPVTSSDPSWSTCTGGPCPTPKQ